MNMISGGNSTMTLVRSLIYWDSYVLNKDLF